MTRHRLFRIWISCAVLVVWAFSLCAVTPSHACCKDPTQRMAMDHGVMPCCVSQPATQALLSDAPQPVGGDGPALSAPVLRLDFSPARVGLNQSSLSQAYRPDQSGRHLELSVLLN